ncbi:MAG: hypothetical protein U0326_08815 [Polyangiales bacterium]
MIRLLLREMLLTIACLVAVTVASFAALDGLVGPDWFGAGRFAHELGIDPRSASTGDLPLVWNGPVDDARSRTRRDLDALSSPATRAAAEARLFARGSAGLPTVLVRLPTLGPAARLAALRVLSRWSPSLTGAEVAPVPAREGDDADALRWWDRFYAARLLDFRPGYAFRQAERLATRDSRNAVERVARLGTYALPALVQSIGEAPDLGGTARVANAMADVTGLPLRLGAGATEVQRGHVTDAWKAFWFARHLEYETLSAWQLTLGHVTETRYGHWLVRALRGRFGRSELSGRPISHELRERLPLSMLTAGLGGLLAVASVIAFGGGPSMRRRALRTKLLDLAGALIPGLGAFAGLWWVALRIAATDADAAHAAASLLAGSAGPRAALGVAACAGLASLWLRRPSKRLILHAVRVEAELWVAESLEPTSLQVLRHGARIGVASLLAPLGLAAPAVLLASLVVEFALGLTGMGALTLRALLAVDAPWLMVAVTTMVPLLLARRWAVGLLGWLLGVRPTPRAPATDTPPKTPATDTDAPTATDTPPAPPGPPPPPPPSSPPSA